MIDSICTHNSRYILPQRIRRRFCDIIADPNNMAFNPLNFDNEWRRPKRRDADAKEEKPYDEFEKFQGDFRPQQRTTPGKVPNDLQQCEFSKGAVYWLAGIKLWVGAGDTQLRKLASLFANWQNRWHDYNAIKQTVYGKSVADKKLRKVISRLRKAMREHESDDHAIIVCQPCLQRYAMMVLSEQRYRSSDAPEIDGCGNVVWLGKQFLPPDETKLKELFLLLAKYPGRAYPTIEIEQLVYEGRHTDIGLGHSATEMNQVDQKIRQLISRLNKVIGSCGLENRATIECCFYRGRAYRLVLLPDDLDNAEIAA